MAGRCRIEHDDFPVWVVIVLGEQIYDREFVGPRHESSFTDVAYVVFGDIYSERLGVSDEFFEVSPYRSRNRSRGLISSPYS
jgi:hypothetical protein